MTRPQYRRPETAGSDIDTPVTFYSKGEGGFLPGEGSAGEKLFFCLAEMYEASIKDYDALNTTDLEYAITLKIPHPREDYIPRKGHAFEVEELLYKDVIFDIENIAPAGDGMLKIVGASYVG